MSVDRVATTREAGGWLKEQAIGRRVLGIEHTE